jgi:hypothetical protein
MIQHVVLINFRHGIPADTRWECVRRLRELATLVPGLTGIFLGASLGRSVRDRAPGLLVETMRRKAESAGGDRLYEFNPKTTALSQTCLCGNRKKKPLSQRVHCCGCGITEDRDLFSAYLGLHVGRQADGSDRLDLQAANHGWLHRQDVDGLPRPSRTASLNRRGRRHPPLRRSVARIKARRVAKRQSRSARTSTINRPTALPT